MLWSCPGRGRAGAIDTPLIRHLFGAGNVALADRLVEAGLEAFVAGQSTGLTMMTAGIEAAADDPLDFTLIFRTLFPGWKKETIAYELRGQGDNCVDG